MLSPTLFLTVIDILMGGYENRALWPVCLWHLYWCRHPCRQCQNLCCYQTICCQAKRDNDKFHQLIVPKTQCTKAGSGKTWPKANRITITGNWQTHSTTLKCLGVWWQYNLSASRKTYPKLEKLSLQWGI